MTDLPRKVVEQDRRLERAATSASEELAYLRWHWTLDESNAGRVALRAYARAVGRTLKTIQSHAHGYALAADGDVPVSEAIERAGMSADREAATEAVAKARDLSFSHVRQSRPAEARRVLNMARERSEETGRPVADEARKAAKLIVQAEEAADREQHARRSRKGLRLIELEELLQRVRRDLSRGVKLASDVKLGDDERELLEDTLRLVKSLIALLDLAIVGSSDVDWDTELAQLGGGK